ncbi:hypothetical protein KQH60_05715 [Mycetohabitans sp. B8]|uniref:hypothetical protein n=1 Tax=Mycetohabitans sp. B8 TaxID=2841845 RepID=UPI001F240E7A|nr:hypothetical protein [Mycetohabitans sp. B8]MCG1042081.1 hypothetical protein [Mycetohabitans sp. B8]
MVESDYRSIDSGATLKADDTLVESMGTQIYRKGGHRAVHATAYRVYCLSGIYLFREEVNHTLSPSCDAVPQDYWPHLRYRYFKSSSVCIN